MWACNQCDQGLESGKEMQEKSENDKVSNIDTFNRSASGYEYTNEDEVKAMRKKIHKEQVKLKLKKMMGCSIVNLVKKDLMEMKQ